MARGLRAGDERRPPDHRCTRTGAQGSPTAFHDEPWLDFNMRQNGHAVEFTGRYDQTRVDYDRTPIKPVVDGEPIYEDHPVTFNAADARPLDRRRRAARRSTGICSAARSATPTAITPSGSSGRPDARRSTTRCCPGSRRSTSPARRRCSTRARSSNRGRSSRAFPTTTVDRHRSGVRRACREPAATASSATRDANGSYAMVYAPVGRPFTVRMSKITGAQVRRGGSTLAPARRRRSTRSPTPATARSCRRTPAR